MPLFVPPARGEIYLSAGNGEGSTNTAIMRFSTTDTTKAGTALTLTQSATNGDSITINEAGTYTVGIAMEGATNTAVQAGVSLNSAQLTTAISGITAANRIVYGYEPATAGDNSLASGSRTLTLSVGDVIRPHTGISPTNTSARTYFYVCKVVS